MKSKLFRTIARGVILGVSILIFAGVSYAAISFNEYGTSEEFTFWGNAAPTVLQTLGCTGTAKYAPTGVTTSGVAVGTGCPDSLSSENGTHDNTIYFSYTNKPSWDAIGAVNDFYDSNNWGTWDTTGFFPAFNPNSGNNPCTTDITVAGVTYHPGSQRQVATCPSGGCSSTNLPTLQCQPVHVGSANLESTSIIQQTNGTLKGPLDQQDAGTAATVRNFGANGPPTNNLTLGTPAFTFTNTDLAGLPTAVQFTNYAIDNPARPLAYPFGFYVNPGVQATMCNTGATNPALIGSYCTTATVTTDCGAGSAASACTQQTITNLSRLQVVALFSGKIANWSDFGGYYVNKPVTLCLRHSGAGTLSVIDLGVMNGPNGTNWGDGLVPVENRASTASPPYIYFNDLAGDELNCLQWSAGGYTASSSVDTLATGEQGGGVGFIDADTANNSSYYVQVKYNGVWPNRVTMRDGIYDNFWMVDALYIPSHLTEVQMTVYATMLSLFSNPANINSSTVGSKSGFYGVASELNFQKSLGATYPDAYSPAATPVSP